LFKFFLRVIGHISMGVLTLACGLSFLLLGVFGPGILALKLSKKQSKLRQKKSKPWRGMTLSIKVIGLVPPYLDAALD
jgi:hypothetical protein